MTSEYPLGKKSLNPLTVPRGLFLPYADVILQVAMQDAISSDQQALYFHVRRYGKYDDKYGYDKYGKYDDKYGKYDDKYGK